MSQLFETMINQGCIPFLKRLEKFLKSKGKDINDYTDGKSRKYSNHDTIYVYDNILEVDGFEKFIEACNLVNTGTESSPKITRKAIILSPKNDNIIWDAANEQLVNFSELFKRSKLYHISLPEYRNSIIINGLRPKSKRFNSEEDGEENHDERVYFVVSGLIDYVNKNQNKNLRVEQVINSLKMDMSIKRKYFGKYDVWETVLPDGIELHRDPKFPFGGFVTCNIPPKFIRLMDEKELC